MKVFIITMDDPVHTVPFIKNIIEVRQNWIVGVAIVRGDRLRIRKSQSKFGYLLALLLIMGPYHFLRNIFITLCYKLLKAISPYSSKAKQRSLKGWIETKGIPVLNIDSANDKTFLGYLRTLKPDVIINQSQSILKSELLSIPTIGVINRHNALLPKNRGRLTPFWVLYRQEKNTGVSIHFVTEKLDAGAIIVQKQFPVMPSYSFNRLVEINYSFAAQAMIEALDLLASGNTVLIPNNDDEATYNSTPTFKEALKFRLTKIKLAFTTR